LPYYVYVMETCAPNLNVLTFHSWLINWDGQRDKDYCPYTWDWVSESMVLYGGDSSIKFMIMWPPFIEYGFVMPRNIDLWSVSLEMALQERLYMSNNCDYTDELQGVRVQCIMWPASGMGWGYITVGGLVCWVTACDVGVQSLSAVQFLQCTIWSPLADSTRVCWVECYCCCYWYFRLLQLSDTVIYCSTDRCVSLYMIGLVQGSCSTLSPVNCGMGDCFHEEVLYQV